MKNLSSMMLVLLCLCMQPLTKAVANPPGSSGTVTAFWLDVAVVNEIAESGATTLKIYAGSDASGNLYYIMVGGDGSYRTVGTQAFMQNSKGVCPRQCEFTSVDLGDDNNDYVSESSATTYIKNYKDGNDGAKNCAMFTLSSLSTIRRNCSYIKVTMSTQATAAGLKSDGTAVAKSTATGSVAVADL